MDKKEVRSIVLKSLKNLPEANRKLMTDELFNQFIKMISDNNYNTIALYYGVTPEIETYKLCEILREKGKLVVLPRVESNRNMTFREYNGQHTLEISKFGVFQPVEESKIINNYLIDIILVPGLAYTLTGKRIGFGGGYYDRFLAENPNINSYSLAFPQQIFSDDYWNSEYHDIPIKNLIKVGNNK